MAFLPIGYYIVAVAEKPDWISLPCTKILSVSNCICDLYPKLDGCYWENTKKEYKKYQQFLNLSDEAFETMKKTVFYLLGHDELDFALRFASYEKAKRFYMDYIADKESTKLICLTAEEKIFQDIVEEMELTKVPTPILYEETSDKLLGFEILGFDVSAFHSYLCNGLEKDIQAEFHLETNDIGIIQNDYAMVIQFADFIQGQGEPVIWFPFALFDKTPL